MIASGNYAPAPRFVWPGGKRCAAMLCFDVDGETTALSEDAGLAHRRSIMSQCEYGPRIGVPRLLGLLDHLTVPATFFIPGYIAERHPRMPLAVADRGHEIGLHSYLHEKLNHVNEAEETAILERSFSVLEKLGDHPAGGHVHHGRQRE